LDEWATGHAGGVTGVAFAQTFLWYVALAVLHLSTRLISSFLPTVNRSRFLLNHLGLGQTKKGKKKIYYHHDEPLS
jgi:hypothetical protein